MGPNDAAPLLARRMLIAAIVLLFTLSSMSLSVVGFRYDLPDGPFWQKLHPATFLAVAALMLDIGRRRRPLDRIAAIPAQFPAAAYFLCMWALLLAYGLLIQHVPFTALFEPYAFAVVALFMIPELSRAQLDGVRRFLNVVICVNAAIGFLEYLSHERLFPYVIGGLPVDDYRSTALLGHPLDNAATTGAYMLCLAMGGVSGLTPMWRGVALFVAGLGMIAFGGRTATAFATFFIVLIVLFRSARILAGARFHIRHALALFLGAPVAAASLVVAAQAGVFDAFTSRYIDDNGSGAARLIALDLFDRFETGDLLFGPPVDVLNSTLNSLGIEIGVENNWLALLFQYGAWMAVFFSIGLFALFYEFWRRADAGATVLFVYYLAIISSSIGLASKTLNFAQFAVLLLVLFPRRDAPARTTAEEGNAACIASRAMRAPSRVAICAPERSARWR